LEFISQGSDDEDFAIIAGIDTDLAPNGFQTKFGILPIMDIVSYNVSGGTGLELKERAVLRNSIVLGTYYLPPSTTSYGVEVVEGTILSNCGFVAGATPAFRSAVMQHATLHLKSNTA
jgi:ethanolamine utilization microcompartment shell protein EutL